MSIQKINTLETNFSTNFLNDSAQEYVIQALSNLGQRIGIKGDGIKLETISFFDIFDNIEKKSYSGSHGTVKLENNKIFFNVDGFDEETFEYINNTVYLSESHDVEQILTNFDVIGNESIIHVTDDKLLICFLKCKLAGTFESDIDNVSYIVFKYDLNTNKVLNMQKAYNIFNSINNKVYLYYDITFEEDAETNTQYSISIYKLLDSNINEKLFNFSETINRFAELKNSIINDKCVSLLDLFDIDDVNKLYSTNIKCAFSTENNVGLDIYNYYSSTDNSMFLNELREYNIAIPEIFEYFNTESNLLLKECLGIFDDRMFKNSKQIIAKKLYSELYFEIYENQNAVGTMYVPLNQSLYYFANSNNSLEIYHSYNFYVVVGNKKLDKSISYVIDKSSVINQTLSLGFIFDTYEFENTIYSLNVKFLQEYTYPYINGLNNWVINNEETDISSVGKDAGNPNILIAYYNNDKCKILNNDLLDEIQDFVETTININELNDQAGDEVFTVLVPKVSNNFNFEYSTLLLMFAYNDMHYFTFWQPTLSNDNEIEFKPIRISDNKILHLGRFYNKTQEDKEHNESLTFLVHDNYSSGTNYKYYSIFKYPMSLRNYNKTSTDDQEIYSNSLELLSILCNKEIQDNETFEEWYNKLCASDDRSYYLDGVNDTVFTPYDSFTVNESDVLNNIEIEETQTGASSYKTTYYKLYALKNLIYSTERIEEEYIDNVIKYNILINTLSNNQSFVKDDRNKLQEYIFNYNVPVLNNEEFIQMNSTVLNRQNILTLDKSGKLYNAFIGSSFTDDEKNVFHISSVPQNINLGSCVLSNDLVKYNLNTHDTVSVDFPSIKLNSSNSIVAKSLLSVPSGIKDVLSISFNNLYMYDKEVTDRNESIDKDAPYYNKNTINSSCYIYNIKYDSTGDLLVSVIINKNKNLPYTLTIDTNGGLSLKDQSNVNTTVIEYIRDFLINSLVIDYGFPDTESDNDEKLSFMQVWDSAANETMDASYCYNLISNAEELQDEEASPTDVVATTEVASTTEVATTTQAALTYHKSPTTYSELIKGICNFDMYGRYLNINKLLDTFNINDIDLSSVTDKDIINKVEESTWEAIGYNGYNYIKKSIGNIFSNDVKTMKFKIGDIVYVYVKIDSIKSTHIVNVSPSGERIDSQTYNITLPENTEKPIDYENYRITFVSRLNELKISNRISDTICSMPINLKLLYKESDKKIYKIICE